MQTEMEIDLTGDTSNVFEPTLPAVPGAAPGELRRRHNELGLTKCVSERNLSEARGVGEDFFAGIPSTDEVAREKKISATEAELHLAIACRTGGLACVRLESTHLPVHRKTEGFVARDWRIITVLLERLQAALQNEYQTRFNSVPSKKDIQKLYEARMSTVEATTLGRMTRLFVGLSDLEELLRAEAVEATTAIPGPSSEERTWLEIDRRATHAVESPTGPQAPSGPEPQRRAIDAPAWHSEHFPISFWPRTARPGVLVVESRIPEATVKALRDRGHIVEVGPAWSEGRLTAASQVGERRRAAANPRGMQGYAVGR